MKCGLMRKIVTWDGMHVSALHSQKLSNDVYCVVTLAQVPVSEVVVGDSLWSRNRRNLNLYGK
jgi:hypothetical protein